MSRKVRRRSLFHRFKFKKKYKRIFTQVLYYVSLFERQIVFVLKKMQFTKTVNQGVIGLLNNYFFINNQIICNPQYLIGNNTIIQKKIYSSSLLSILFKTRRKKLIRLQK